MGPYRKALILGIIGFCVVEGVYVSVPDFCYDAHPWEIMLWGESSQWWSEITWIGLFGVFSVSLVYVVDWSRSIRNPRVEAYQRVCRIVFLAAFLSLVWNFSALFFHWGGWVNSLFLDRGGYLHGVFYLSVALEGLWLFEELIGLMSKIVLKLAIQGIHENTLKYQ
jgi:hypothetical protein